MRTKVIFLGVAISLVAYFNSSAQDYQGQVQIKDSVSTQSKVIEDKSTTIPYQQTHNTGTLSDFPRIHPLVVHFPIVLLLLALITQVFSFFLLKNELSWATLILVAAGFTGAIIASYVFHGGDPNIKLLDNISQNNFEKHELYANITVWVSGIGTFTKILSNFVFKMNRFSEMLVTLFLLASAYSIAITGDMGARLVHVDGVGVQGNKIPEHDED